MQEAHAQTPPPFPTAFRTAGEKPPPFSPLNNIPEVRVLLSAAVETTLVSPMAGRVRKSSLSMGGAFKKGQTLMTFVCDERNARADMGNAELSAAQINHENKLKLQGLSQAGEIEVALAANEVARTSAQFELFRAQQRKCTVLAPFKGRVAKIIVKPHQGVIEGEPILEILSAGPLKLKLNAPGRWLSWLKPGVVFILLIDETAKTYKARISAVNSRVDTVSHTIEVEATLGVQSSELLPGMSGAAHFDVP